MRKSRNHDAGFKARVALEPAPTGVNDHRGHSTTRSATAKVLRTSAPAPFPFNLGSRKSFR